MPHLAFAHVVNRRFGDFYAGMLHPFAGFEHILPIIAMALLAGQRGAAAGRAVLLAFPLSLAAGITLGMTVASPLRIIDMINLGSFIVLGALVAGAWRLPAKVLPLLAIFFGLTLGFANGVDLTSEVSAALFLLGVVATSVIITALGAAMVVSLKSDWQNIAVRVAGSWILAIGILMLGLA
ncbi:MAG: HupE/UreJ family protein [bacterium]